MGNHVTIIGRNAFYMMDGLKKINLSNNLEKIETFGFMGCMNSEDIFIPDSIIDLESCCFKYNPKLKFTFHRYD